MILKMFMLFYQVLWIFLLPAILLYLRMRGRKDDLYWKHLGERFGHYSCDLPQSPIWIHAVSIGELRSSTALIHIALKRGHRVLVTTFTPTGRRETERQFAAAIAERQLAVIWVPFDMGWCHRRLIKACQPRICLPLEVEIWPAMIITMRKANVPLYLCNAQYARRSVARDSRGLRIRQKVIARCAGAFVKSGLQKERFAAIGVPNILVTGELRFDQEVPTDLTTAAVALREAMPDPERQIVAIASGVENEEDVYLEMILELRKWAQKNGRTAPLIVYVPRAPERFAQVGNNLEKAGLKVCRRSREFAACREGLRSIPKNWSSDIDVFLGDSLGEMYFYLTLSDKVIVGGGFSARGAHNIIEPLAVAKPVFVGPYTWTIEFPFFEAETAGFAQSYATPNHMIAALLEGESETSESLAGFMDEHRGASERTLRGIDAVIGASDSPSSPCFEKPID